MPKKSKFVVIGVTFDPRDADYVNNLLGSAEIPGAAEGSSVSGYWITTTQTDAQKALWRIQTSIRFREMDLNLSIVDQGDLRKEWSRERVAELIRGLPGSHYQEASTASLDRFYDGFPK